MTSDAISPDAPFNWLSLVQSTLTGLESISQTPNASRERLHTARQTALEAIDTSLAIVVYTHGLHNSLTPIGRLPAEILARIFRHVIDIYPMRSPDIGWIKVTHVCRSFRRAALDNSSLWSTIPFNIGNNWTRNFLDRSKNSSLHVQCWLRDRSPGEQRFPDVLAETLTSHMGRIRELWIHGPEEAICQLFKSDSVVKNAPQLERLGVECSSRSRERLIPPTTLFGGHIPRLRHVVLAICPGSLAWLKPAENLVSLYLVGPDTPRLSYDAYKRLLDALEHARGLEFLWMTNCLPLAESKAVTHIGRVLDLCNLKTVHIVDCTSDIIRFLGQIHLAPSAAVQLKCLQFRPTHHLPLLHVMSNLRSTGRPVPTKVIIREAQNSVKLVASDCSSACSIPSLNDRRQSNFITLRCHTSDWKDEPLVSSFCSLLQLDQLESLEITWKMEQTVTPQEWVDIFGCARKLRTLELGGSPAESFCRALSMSVLLPDPKNTPPASSSFSLPQRNSAHTLFPSLHDLTLREVDFRQTMDGHPLHQLFAHALTVRTASPEICPPRLLSIELCFVRREWVNFWLFCVPEDQRVWNVDSWSMIEET
ncbi:hypothetical protein OF83DRAFT_197467 [Amylostereum chailletii]|nr:hypothetical protein OF83DRAFT_197467 [Amylostereum chailletii]